MKNLSSRSRPKTWRDGIRRSHAESKLAYTISLETRRMYLSPVECFMTFSNLPSVNSLSRGKHSYKLFVKPAKCNPFPTRIVHEWNSLPRSVVEANRMGIGMAQW